MMKRHSRANVVTAAAAAFIAANLLLASQALAAEPPAGTAPQVTVVRAANACFSAEVYASGFLVSRSEAIVSLVTPGLKVSEVLVEEGDRVTSGQVLVRLTRQTAEGPEPGPPGGGNAPGGNATGGNNLTLKSPAAGLITRSIAVVGSVASPMRPEPLFRIAVGDEVELEVEVSNIHIPELSAGQAVRVEMENGRELLGRVRVAPPEVDPRTQLGKARISLETVQSLRIGMFGTAVISANRSCGVSVPTTAILYATGGPRIQVVRDSRIQTLVVQVGLHSDTQTEIRSGLREDDVVVANAGTSLREGDQVTAVFADGTRL